MLSKEDLVYFWRKAEKAQKIQKMWLETGKCHFEPTMHHAQVG